MANDMLRIMKKSGKIVLYAKNFYLQQELRGILDYARGHGWQLELPQMYGLPGHVRNWRGTGLLTDTAGYTEPLHAAGVKIVALSLDPKLTENADAVVAPDNRRIGEIAADYFLRRGHRNFAACRDVYGRDDAFAARLEPHGFSVRRIAMPRYYRSRKALEQLAAQLARLPRPAAVFCNNDWEAVSVLNAADLAGIPVPRGLAVLGVGNEELICSTASPRLSSIDTRLYFRGLRAAEELDRVMEGAPPRDRPILIAPDQVVERASSDFFAVENRTLRTILEYLRRHTASPIRLGELQPRFHVSESTVRRLFHDGIGQSPKEFLNELRLNLARARLIDSDDTIGAIAAECGFPSSAALYELFSRRYGQTPSAWRQNSVAGTREALRPPLTLPTGSVPVR